MFLTIKKRVFENLKNSADSFSNRLLNKFFGNEDNEEESHQEYQSNVQQNDINIIKFKSSNENNNLMRKENSFLEIFAGMLIFLLIYFISFVLKYLDFRSKMGKIFEFITFYDKINNGYTNFLLSFNVIKSYLYDPNIPILNTYNTKKEFIHSFVNISEKIEDSIIYFSKIKSFLNQKDLDTIELYLYNNFTALLNNESIHFLEPYLPRQLKKGLIPGITRALEILRLINIKYYSFPDIGKPKPDTPSFLLLENNTQLNEINILIRYLIRPSFNNIIELILSFK